MRHVIRAAASAFLLLAGTTLTNADEPATNPPEKGEVVLFGTVERVHNEREFILRDNDGRMTVKQPRPSAILAEGDSVTVSGDIVDDTVLASSVEVDQRASM